VFLSSKLSEKQHQRSGCETACRGYFCPSYRSQISSPTSADVTLPASKHSYPCPPRSWAPSKRGKRDNLLRREKAQWDGTGAAAGPGLSASPQLAEGQKRNWVLPSLLPALACWCRARPLPGASCPLCSPTGDGKRPALSARPRPISLSRGCSRARLYLGRRGRQRPAPALGKGGGTSPGALRHLRCSGAPGDLPRIRNHVAR